MSARLWQRLEDLQFSHDAVGGVEKRILSDAGFRAVTELTALVGAKLVWTYWPPDDGSFAQDDERLARAVGFTPRRWLRVRDEVTQFFRIVKGRWHLDRDWISIGPASPRFAIPRDIRAQVLAREGRRCTYCGATDGPFDYDHIFPVSRGGTNDPSNMTLACAFCNRSKGDRTLAEWMADLKRGASS